MTRAQKAVADLDRYSGEHLDQPACTQGKPELNGVVSMPATFTRGSRTKAADQPLAQSAPA
jgi:hypothetical protein